MDIGMSVYLDVFICVCMNGTCSFADRLRAELGPFALDSLSRSA
jgi:hypothetical protein